MGSNFSVLGLDAGVVHPFLVYYVNHRIVLFYLLIG